MNSVQERIKDILKAHPQVLFMKGRVEFPECGFSAQVVSLLQHYNAHYHSVDVLQDDEIREGIKEYGNWPTIPQFYLNGQLIGGCDILMDMHESGELKALLTPEQASS